MTWQLTAAGTYSVLRNGVEVASGCTSATEAVILCALLEAS